MPPKKVAIIGAGPSGLVTAKTLLHQYPQGTFAPIVFDARHEVGGLWPHSSSSAAVQQQKTNGPSEPATLDPSMRTNLSRFTVAFSDLAWESVIRDAEIPMFPQAKQVGLYLAKYTERYLPAHVLRLGHKVVRAVRDMNSGAAAQWTVHWVKDCAENSSTDSDSRAGKTVSETFDLLVVASGYFARPYMPAIPGLETFTGKVVHSSALQNERGQVRFCNEADMDHGNAVVIGGSMSGVEAASALALHRSSVSISMGVSEQPQTSSSSPTVHHIYSRPFRTLPTYLPHEIDNGEECVSFLPLDLAMYDLARRPPGPVEYSLGPVPEDKAAKTNSYFRSMLGADYEQHGMDGQEAKNESESQAPWVAIGNDYAEFVRSGAIYATMGRATAINSDDERKERASVTIQLPDGRTKTIDNVTSIIMATGFTPFESLSFLPADILATLEYSAEDSFSPLILDKGGVVRAEIPDIGFVGFYRGPYWGVMEMQARFLGQLWAADDGAITRAVKTETERQSLRDLRSADPVLRRGQFPMGDYVGLMESFAGDLGISRTGLLEGDDDRSGPVIPARYGFDRTSSASTTMGTVQGSERQISLDAIRTTLTIHNRHYYYSTAAAVAVFRALHGTWTVVRKKRRSDTDQASETVCGTVTFRPRYASDPGYDREYICERDESVQAGHSPPLHRKTCSIFRLPEPGPESRSSRIEVWTTQRTDPLAAETLSHVLQLTPFYRKKRDGVYLFGQYVIHAQGIICPEYLQREAEGARDSCSYTFHFEGVSISSWECVDFNNNGSTVEEMVRPRV